MQSRSVLLIAAIMLAVSCGKAPDRIEPGPPQTYQVYFLAGQSNMVGYGQTRDIPPELREPVEGVFIFHGRMRKDDGAGAGIGLWRGLAPGHGRAFDTNGRRNSLSRWFGPELSFGRRMHALRPDERIAIIKYARGATALMDGVSRYGSWDPDYQDGDGLNQYDHALATLRNALSARDVNGDGVEDKLVPAGIIWMQGESDAAYDRGAALAYEDNLRRLMSLFREALGDETLPVVIGRIRDSGDTPETRVMKYSPEVREQQAAFVEADPCAALVTASDGFGFRRDGWHYRSEDYVALGQAFAEAALALENEC